MRCIGMIMIHTMSTEIDQLNSELKDLDEKLRKVNLAYSDALKEKTSLNKRMNEKKEELERLSAIKRNREKITAHVKQVEDKDTAEEYTDGYIVVCEPLSKDSLFRSYRYPGHTVKGYFKSYTDAWNYLLALTRRYERLGISMNNLDIVYERDPRSGVIYSRYIIVRLGDVNENMD